MTKKAAKAAKKPGKKPARKPKPDLLDAAEIDSMFARLQAANPHPVSELEYTSPYTLLVAVVLSAQATDAGVNKATRKLFAAADTPAQMAALGEDGIKQHIKTIGLFNAKARNVLALSEILCDQFDSVVPEDRDILQTLPGVGRKTANVVMNVAFGHKTMAVDTHVFRVSNRTGLAHGTTPEAIEDQLMARVPDSYMDHAHHWLILHGRYICKAPKPLCGQCQLTDLCRFYRQLHPIPKTP